MKKKREQFMRICQAVIKPHYPYLPQRVAEAAKMYTKFINRLKPIHKFNNFNQKPEK